MEAVRSRRVVTPYGSEAADVLFDAGRIVAVEPIAPRSFPVRDVGELVVMPAVVDSHVHVNEPGRTEWEGFLTATDAAAAGGIGTIIDMPLNCIPVTTSLAAFKTKLAAIDGLLRVDAAFWGGVIPGNVAELEPMVRAGVVGFKAFMVHSGIDEFPAALEPDLRAAMQVLARLRVPLLVHAEVEEHLHPQPAPSRPYADYLASRPNRAEDVAIERIIALCRETRCHVHIVHLSSATALPAIERAKQDGLPLTVETCPHYLTFAAEEIPDGRTEFKCAPPIRERENSDLLWDGLDRGLIDQVVSDHSPCTPALKCADTGDFAGAWGGIASVQLGLSATWTGLRARGGSLGDLTDWLCEQPARLAGLWGRKGAIEAGFDADFAIVDPEARFVVTAERIHHRHKVTPYLGRTLFGRVMATLVRGHLVFDDGTFAGRSGTPLFRMSMRTL